MLTASITTPAFVRYSRTIMEEGRERPAAIPNHDLGAVIVGSVDEDPKTAREGAREMAAMYLANKVQNIRGSADTLLEKAGLTFDEIRPIADAMESGGRKAAASAVTDAVFDKVCPIAGTPEQCIRRIEEYRAAGCTHILLELWGDDRLEQAKLFGETVFRISSTKTSVIKLVSEFCPRAAPVSVAADRIPDHAVRIAPYIRHLLSDFPQLRKKSHSLPFVQISTPLPFNDFASIPIVR